MKNTVIFSDSLESDRTHTKSVNAIAEVDEFGCPFAAEVLWIKERVGDGDSGKLFAVLKAHQITHNYSDEVDTLTLSFGEGVRSCGQERGVLEMEFNGDTLVGLRLRQRVVEKLKPLG